MFQSRLGYFNCEYYNLNRVYQQQIYKNQREID